MRRATASTSRLLRSRSDSTGCFCRIWNSTRPSFPTSLIPPAGPSCAPASPKLSVKRAATNGRSEEHTSELQSLMRSSYAVFCLKKNKKNRHADHEHIDKAIRRYKDEDPVNILKRT